MDHSVNRSRGCGVTHRHRIFSESVWLVSSMVCASVREAWASLPGFADANNSQMASPRCGSCAARAPLSILSNRRWRKPA